MKKIIAFILILTMLLTLCSCAKVKSAINAIEEEINAIEEDRWVGKEENVAAFLEHEDKQVTIEETVIYDKDGIRFIASDLRTYYDGDWWGVAINLCIENNSATTQTFSWCWGFINQCEIDCMLYDEESQERLSTNDGFAVPAGEQMDVIVNFNPHDLKDSGMEIISSIQLIIENGDPFSNAFFRSDLLKTSAAAVYEDGFIPEGKMIYNENGVKIVLLEEDLELLGYENQRLVKAFVRNDRNEAITIRALVGVNGEQLTNPDERYRPGKTWPQTDYFARRILIEPGVGGWGEFVAHNSTDEVISFKSAEAYIQIVPGFDGRNAIAETDLLTIYPIEDAVAVP